MLVPWTWCLLMVAATTASELKSSDLDGVTFTNSSRGMVGLEAPLPWLLSDVDFALSSHEERVGLPHSTAVVIAEGGGLLLLAAMLLVLAAVSCRERHESNSDTSLENLTASQMSQGPSLLPHDGSGLPPMTSLTLTGSIRSARTAHSFSSDHSIGSSNGGFIETPSLASSGVVPKTASVLLPVLMTLAGGFFVFASVADVGQVQATQTSQGTEASMTVLMTIHLPSAFRTAIQGKLYGGACVLLLFAGLWPLAQLVTMLVIWILPGKCLKPKTRGHVLSLLFAGSKATLAVPWLLLLLGSSLRSQFHSGEGAGTVTTNIQLHQCLGLQSFMAGAFLSLAVLTAVARHHWRAFAHSSSQVMPSGGVERALWHYARPCGRRFLGPFILLTLVGVVVVGWPWLKILQSWTQGLGSFVNMDPVDDSGLNVWQSLVSIWLQVAKDSDQDVSSLILQVSFFMLVLAAPLVQHCCLLVLWTAPLKQKHQDVLLAFCSALDAWTALDVFAVVLGIAAFGISSCSGYLLKESGTMTCEDLTRQFRIECFHAAITLDIVGFALLTIVAYLTHVVPKAALRSCIRATRVRNEVAARARASAAFAAAAHASAEALAAAVALGGAEWQCEDC